VKLIKLKRTQSVCTEKERKRKGKRGKMERKQSFFSFFSQKKLTPVIIKKNKKNALAPGDRAGVPCHPGVRVPI
jgi:hypothetical protein